MSPEEFTELTDAAMKPYGSLRGLAKALECSAGYLCQLRKGRWGTVNDTIVLRVAAAMWGSDYKSLEKWLGDHAQYGPREIKGVWPGLHKTHPGAMP